VGDVSPQLILAVGGIGDHIGKPVTSILVSAYRRLQGHGPIPRMLELGAATAEQFGNLVADYVRDKCLFLRLAWVVVLQVLEKVQDQLLLQVLAVLLPVAGLTNQVPRLKSDDPYGMGA
jgi:hypothetical protein